MITNLMNFLYSLFHNKIFLSVFYSMIVSVLIKISLILIKEKTTNLSSLYRSGGMPSTHTSSVIGLTFGILIFEGVSTFFVMSLVFAAVVLYDAMGVRLETEKHAKFLNELIKQQKFNKKYFSEHVGHKLPEVLAGMLIGIIVPTVIFYI